MRILLTVSNWRGNYYCTVPLAWALQAAGHEVRVACVPEQAGAVTEAGLVPVPVLHGPDVMLLERLTRYGEARAAGAQLPPHPLTGEPVDDPDAFDLDAAWSRVWDETLETMRRSGDAAVALARAWRPDLVLWDLMSEEGALAAEVTGVPAVFHPPGLFGTVEIVDGEDMSPGDPAGSFARHGLGSWGRDRIRYVVDPSPRSVALPMPGATRLSVRYLPYNGPGAMPPWVLDRPARPRVCVIWGNAATAMWGTRMPALRDAVDAAVAAGADVVLTAGDRQVDALGELPPQVRVLRNFPVHMLLATSDVVVHHGSANSLMPAAAAGVPQLSLAVSNDMELVSGRLAGTGAVLTLPARHAAPDEIHRALHALLHDPAHREAAHAVRDEMAGQPAPADLVGPLERLARTGELVTA
ncbi:nucleotide disphospho-sugar-binding domain-containing protein [Micromonospora auratinigra]|uniref:UDP:flavonoid glycosyltransferase YjiC, YdhE family n=1 Tax=Micromonospora auratinigra TaxID=261654 RepID=A0A1A8ZG36_9ACTN|nr:nucleotide disphospho-sugar-binding domain-containing protein [Micromonospora auratinigra]SBT42838.1 UDP:flavonoid glycosyltransferase YjiC, YdhE family [Micromonospora auratinigra]